MMKPYVNLCSERSHQLTKMGLFDSKCMGHDAHTHSPSVDACMHTRPLLLYCQLFKDRYDDTAAAGTGDPQCDACACTLANMKLGWGGVGGHFMQRKAHDYFDIFSNDIAVSPRRVMFFVSSVPLRPSSLSLAFCRARPPLYGQNILHLHSGYNEALLHTIKTLCEPLPRNISYSFHPSSASSLPMPTALPRLLLPSPPPTTTTTPRHLRRTRQHTSLFPLALSFPPRSC